MDDSDTRRGMPAAHRALATRHADAGLGGRRRPLRPRGRGARRQPLPHLDRRGLRDLRPAPRPTSPAGRQVFDLMRTQLMAGQFLDVVESMRPWDGLPDAERVERAGRVIRYKSAKYTVEHPLLIGAHDRRARRRRPRRALALRPRPRPRVPAARRPARGLRRPGARRASPPATTCARASAPCCSPTPSPGTDAAGRGRVEALLGRPDLDAAQVDELRDVIEGSGAVGAARGRDRPPRGAADGPARPARPAREARSTSSTSRPRAPPDARRSASDARSDASTDAGRIRAPGPRGSGAGGLEGLLHRAAAHLGLEPGPDRVDRRARDRQRVVEGVQPAQDLGVATSRRRRAR